MRIHTTELRGVTVATVPGDSLEAHNADDLREQLAGALDAGGGVVVDLAALTFVDSSGLSALLSCHKRAAAAGGRLELCGLAPHVRSLFELVGMDRVFGIHGTREEALVSFDRDPVAGEGVG